MDDRWQLIAAEPGDGVVVSAMGTTFRGGHRSGGRGHGCSPRGKEREKSG